MTALAVGEQLDSPGAVALTFTFGWDFMPAPVLRHGAPLDSYGFCGGVADCGEVHGIPPIRQGKDQTLDDFQRPALSGGVVVFLPAVPQAMKEMRFCSRTARGANAWGEMVGAGGGAHGCPYTSAGNGAGWQR